MYKYTVDYIPKSTPNNRRPGAKMVAESITIHNTGNEKSNARNERGWLTNNFNTRTASFHLVVDESEVIECIPVNEVAWHAGNAQGNRTSIGIEVCESGDQKKTWVNAVRLTAKLLQERGWGVDRVRTHQSWSGKNCPRLILPRWSEFIKDVERDLLRLNGVKEPEKVIPTIPDWKRVGVDYLAADGIINDPEGWIRKIDEPIPVWAAMIILKNIHESIKGGN